MSVWLKQFVGRTLGMCCVVLPFSTSHAAVVDEIFTNGFGDAILILNEIGANITGSQDLIELLAVRGGSILGTDVVINPDGDANFVVLATLPDTTVATGDLIVVHLSPTGVVSESASKTECQDTACYNGAWDIVGGVTGIPYSSRVLAVRTAGGTLTDAVAFARTDTADNSTYPTAVQYLQSIGYWLPADCGGAPCSDTSTPTVVGISADWTGLGISAQGASASRYNGMNSHSAADWHVFAESFGVENP